MRVLNVAEKPAMAKSIAGILSKGDMERRSGLSRFCGIYEFSYRCGDGSFYNMVMTSVLGHVEVLEFPVEYSNWQHVDPILLLQEAPLISNFHTEGVKGIARTIEREAAVCQMLVIWTDCDREGEAIGSSIAKIALGVNRSIIIKRARYSAVTARAIFAAMANLTLLNHHQAHAVEARQELDMRTGCAFTRFLTLNFGKGLISYGPCQFPTLGFVVEQYHKAKNFVSEPFWTLHLHTQNTAGQVKFLWERERLFDPLVTAFILKRLLRDPIGTVVEYEELPITKFKPYPLATIPLCKFGSSYLKISSHRLMKIAESLYNRGYISYPRTETEVFPVSFDFKTLLGQQCADPRWGTYAMELCKENSVLFQVPRKGKRDDHAHPPIHPTRPAIDLEGDDSRIYEYITRRFLASCSKDACGFQVIVKLAVQEEGFRCHGSYPTELNYMQVYPYDQWKAVHIPKFRIGEKVVPSQLTMVPGHTTAPSLLSESDLIATMDRNGIGTDATIHDHINTIIERGYVRRRRDRRLEPSSLGIALIAAFDAIGFSMSLSKPMLRRQLEEDLCKICDGKLEKSALVTKYLTAFMDAYRLMVASRSLIDQEFSKINQEDTEKNTIPESIWRKEAEDVTCSLVITTEDDTSTVEGITKKLDTHNDLRKSFGKKKQKRGKPEVNCGCDIPAVERKVSKPGPNQGRSFFTCNQNPSVCNFFQWADDDNPPSRPPTQKKGKAHTNINDEQMGPNTARCECGLLAKVATVKTGTNAGRKYATCIKRSSSARCKFYTWLDEEPTPATRNTHRPFLNYNF